MSWTIDRRTGAVALVVSAVALLPTVAFTESPLPGRDQAHPTAGASDPEAVAALSRLVALGAEGPWMVEYETERVLAGGGSRAGRVVAASLPPSSIVTDGEFLEATIDKRSFSCARLDTGPICSEGEPQPDGAPDLGALVVGVAEPGRYVVTRSGGRSIAGESAECFELNVAASSIPSGMVRDALLCYAADGVLLSAHVATGTAVDERTAVIVERDIDRGDLVDLLDELDVPVSPGSG